MVGENLIKKGLITPEQLQEAIEVKKQHPTKKLLDVLYEKNYISKENYVKEFAEELGVKHYLLKPFDFIKFINLISEIEFK